MTDDALTQVLKMMSGLNEKVEKMQETIDAQNKALKEKEIEITKLKETPPNTSKVGGLGVEQLLDRAKQEEKSRMTSTEQHMDIAIDSLIRYKKKLDGTDL